MTEHTANQSDTILDRIEIFLQDAESFIVPVEWIWKMLQDECRETELAMEHLIEKMKHDERFRVFDGKNFRVANGQKEIFPDEDKEEDGFIMRPRVMLKNRIPSRKEVLAFLLKKADQTFNALKQTWDIRPQGEEETEDQLLQALAKAQKLQRELRSVLSRVEEGGENE
jgi:hypothetical protein